MMKFLFAEIPSRRHSALTQLVASTLRRGATALLLAIGMLPYAAVSATEPLIVFAAASLKESLDEQLRAFTAASSIVVRASYAGSNTLAQQIDRGAPASIFISADEAWMDYLAQRNRIVVETRRSWFSNELVMIAPAARSESIDLASPGRARAALSERLVASRLAMADPAAVPAGRYAQAALTKLDLWTTVAPRIAPTDNVRGALAFVARGEAALGIVYRTDALAEPKVAVVATFPANTHPPISYPAAVVSGNDNAEARRLLDYLASDAARAVWQKYGFTMSKR
jgi:molybdate transport system substrate-binding protein